MLLLQASMPPCYWADALNTATLLLNLRPTKKLSLITPHEVLHSTPPSYSHLCVFGCLCFPNTSATASHKLSPRSTRCVFIGYPREQKGYRCFDLSTRKVITSRHVIFDETIFLYTLPTDMSQTLHRKSDHPDPTYLSRLGSRGSFPSTIPARAPLDPLGLRSPAPTAASRLALPA